MPKSQGKGRPLLLPTPAGKPYDIRERTFELAVRVLEIASALPSSPEANVVRYQLARAGGSVGANVEEADGAVSKPDKRKSLVIARKESRELHFWLRIVKRRWPAMGVEADLQETMEILRILSAIILRLT